ncbi:unnamed protein product, partial [Adineta ricciae]
MGAIYSLFFRSSTATNNARPSSPPPRQPYSWESPERAAIRKEDFILDKLKDQTIYRLPGSVNGQQFIIQNCDNCSIYVFDYADSIQIDDCTNCRILIGPVRGSIFLRDSINCVLATICQQFRTRDCRDTHVYLACSSQPVIESSHNIKFGCLTLNYKNLAEQYKSAGISPWNNNWSNNHDFTSIPDGKNYSLLDKDDNVFKHLSLPTDPACAFLNVSDNVNQSVTPYTHGELCRDRNEERCLVILFHNANADACARDLITSTRQSNIELVQTKSYRIDDTSVERLFGGDRKYNALVASGPVIGLEFIGANCVSVCQQALRNLLTAKYPNLPHFISQSAAAVAGQLDKFYNFASMQIYSKHEIMNVASSTPADKVTSSDDYRQSSHGDEEEKIVQEFGHLLEKSKQLFNGLRDLPQYGHKQWQPYFGRTFDIYTKLWKFQQQHRVLLDKKYGLKRWQIGEIASKIGQLYYHFYIRTSETNYLNEAFAFYSAMRARAYYSKVNREEKPDLMVKKLRYYARFIVVCLLLKKTKIMRELVRELNRQIDEYVKAYDPDDSLEWQLVLNEISSFIEIDNQLTIDGISTSLSYRLNQSLVPTLPANVEQILSNIQSFSLEEILIIGNYQDQIKFSELTIDMYRMLQAVERQPNEATSSLDDGITTQSPAGHQKDILNLSDNGISNRSNPHKYLLYKPTFSQIYAFTSSAFKELPTNGALLLYISADGYDTHLKSKVDHAYDFGGLKTNNRREDPSENSNSPANTLTKKLLSTSAAATTTTMHKDVHSIFPGDLYPFLRKPLFLIVDSNNSTVFQHMPNLFGQPFVSLLSPVKLPVTFHGKTNFETN